VSRTGDNKKRLARIESWDAPFDLSIAPLLIFLSLIPNTLVELRSTDSTRTVVLWTGIKLLTIAIWFTPLYLLESTLKGFKRREINLFLGGIIGAILGALSGTYVFYAANLLHINHPDENLQRRVISTAIIGFAWLPIGLVLSQSFGNIKKIAYGKEGSPHSLIRQNFRKSAFYNSYIRKNYDAIETELAEISYKLANELTVLASNESMILSNADKILEKLNTKSFRDLSNRIDKDVQAIRQKRTLRLRILTFRNFVSVILISVYKDMKKNPLNPRIFTYVIVVCLLGTQIRNNESVFHIIVFSSLAAALTFAMSGLAVLYWKRTEKYFFEFSIFGLTLNVFFVYLLQEYMRIHGYDPVLAGQRVKTTFLDLILFFFIFFLGHLGNAGVTAKIDIFRVSEFSKIAHAIEAEMLRDQKRLIGRRWAVHIHGKIQTKISSAALAIQQAIDKGDGSIILETIDSISFTLAEPSAGLKQVDRVLEQELEARFAPWAGLLEYETSVDSGLSSLDAIRVRVVGEVLEELISNAVRHGSATQISLNLSMNTRGGIVLYAEDNSTNPPPSRTNRNVGIGTSIFNAASLGRWNLERDQIRGKTVFQMTISPDINFDPER
jgi:two-component sensor histidine kinase